MRPQTGARRCGGGIVNDTGCAVSDTPSAGEGIPRGMPFQAGGKSSRRMTRSTFQGVARTIRDLLFRLPRGHGQVNPE